MQWSEICEKYPNQIVLVEALRTSSKDNIRTVEEMSILSDFRDNMDAWKEYKKIHRDMPEKELYIFHTSKEKAEVIEQFFVGIRGSV
ncbi:hypothetical protein RB620_18890 [Paenibacillus sp. LHD-117]|uniref:hypothetical protein n=1 Tax=Paenibacillus sp. LHD-117 TaxID=3071412 RepID=UPI0027E057DB|nr:hypothetical protein [Paenibacillus sp. LHD-117]MDQ6421496.1 hypothetical protein [Paenibacillus sp. LHD-117]